LLVNLGGDRRKKLDGTFAMPLDDVGAFRLSLLLSNFVRPGLASNPGHPGNSRES
jgi:hypothetical protein